jgi:tripartite motif-containing protein 71
MVHRHRVAGTVFIGALIGAMVLFLAIVGASRASASDAPPALGALPPDLPASIQSADAEEIQIRPGHYIVVLKDSVASPGGFARNQTSVSEKDLGYVYRSALNGYSAALSRSEVAELKGDPRVLRVVPDGKVEATGQSIPTGISRTFAATNPALDIDETDDARINVDIAMVDSGIDYNHPDLNVVSRTDCTITEGICEDGKGIDESGHGTHTAGTAAAIDNGFGVPGMAPGARLWMVRVLNAENWGYWSWSIAGLDWVAAHSSEIEVTGMIVAGGYNSVVNEAVENVVNKGVVVVVAAGNNSINGIYQTPGSTPDAITVSGLADYDGKPGEKGGYTCVNRGFDDRLYDGSDWGKTVDIGAPGVCILSSTKGGGYSSDFWGTSMAAPHVVGAAALLASKSNPNSRADVLAIRDELVNGGSLNWNDNAADGKFEPTLYMGAEPLTELEAVTGSMENTDAQTTTLYGALNPRGEAATYQFEIGPTTEYGQKVPPIGKEVSAEAGYTEASASIAGLTRGQTYHYRIAVKHGSETTYGSDRTFVAPSWRGRPTAGSLGQPEIIETLADVSCASSTSCMATGYTNSYEDTFISYEKKGNDWTRRTVVKPEGVTWGGFDGVSCSSSTACTGVGNIWEGENIKPGAARWNGSSWSFQSVPKPESSDYSMLKGVSCPTSTYCVAVGHYRKSSGQWGTLSAVWSGGAWTLPSTPNPEGWVEGSIDDVSCMSTTNCIAGGSYVATGGSVKPMILKWNGTSWSFQAPARTTGYIYGLSCASASFCMAVGMGPAGERWDGTKWITSTPPDPPEIEGSFLYDVSCASESSCTAVGATRRAPRWFGWAVTWNGTKWMLDSTTHDAERREEMFAVSCLALSGCAGVGSYNGEVYPFVETRDDVYTTAPSGVTSSKATLNGSLNPDGVSATYKFEYGKTQSYGSSVPVPNASAGSGSAVVAASESITGLDAGTEYHYRLVATNAKGTVYGEDVAFRTKAATSIFLASIGSAGSGNGQLSYPRGIAVDASGNFWVADDGNNRVQKFNSKGEYLAKFGTKGSGNGQLNLPTDVAITTGGDLWVTDAVNHRVQKFNSKGEYLAKFGTEGAGNGQFYEPSGIAIAANGDLWVTDSNAERMQQFNSSGTFIKSVGTFGSGNGQFKDPSGIAIDASGNIYVADANNDRIQKFNSKGEYLSQFGTYGTGDGQFAEPQAVDINAAGNVVVVDRETGRIQLFTPSGEFLAKFSSNAWEPDGIAVAPNGVYYVANSRNNRVDKWADPAPPKATTNAASAVTSSAGTLNASVNPRAVATSYRFEYGLTTSYGSKVPIPDLSIGSGTDDVAVSQPIAGLKPSTTYHFRVVATSVEGTTLGSDQAFTTKPAFEFLASIGSAGSGNGQLSYPRGIAVDASGNIWVADDGNNRVQKFNSKGEYLAKFGTKGSGNGQLNLPTDVAITTGGDLWVTEAVNHRVQKFNSKGEYLAKFGTEGSGNGQFYEPSGIAIAANGDLWVTDSQGERMQQFNSSGTFIKSVGSYGSGNGQFKNPSGIAIDPSGNIYVADANNDRIQKFNSKGEYLSQFGTYGTGDGQFAEPQAVDINAAGNVVVTDRETGRVQLFTPSGEFLAKFGVEWHWLPDGLAVGPEGIIYVANSGYNRIDKWLQQ